MSLYNVAAAIGLMRAYRVVYIGGSYGQGKTALAFRLAYELMESGFVQRCVSNCRCVFADKIEDIRINDVNQVNTVIVLDEGGLFIKTGRDASELLSFMRKMNIVLIVCSVEEPTYKLQRLTFQRQLNFDVFGIPLWWYSVHLRTKVAQQKDYFAWWRPSEIFGVYDTLDAPVDDAGIQEWLNELKNRLVKESRQRAGRSEGLMVAPSFRQPTYYQPAVAVPELVVPSSAVDESDGFNEAAERFEDAVVRMESVIGKRRLSKF